MTGGIEQARALLNASAGDEAIVTGASTATPALSLRSLPNLPPPVVTISGENADCPLALQVKNAFDQAIAGRGKLDKRLLSFRGASGRKYRLFINTLVGLLNDARYLEIGSYTGSTLCSDDRRQQGAGALIIDNWSQFGGPVKDFMQNVATFPRAGSESERT